MTDLYRQQAIEFCGAAQFGNVGLHRPIPANITIFGIIFLLVLILAFSVWGTYTRKATVSGYLIPDKGIITAVAPTGGTITEIYVHEGDNVQAGAPLFRIKPERFSVDSTNVNEDIADKIDAQRQNLKKIYEQKHSYFNLEKGNLIEQLKNITQERQFLKETIFYVSQQVQSQQKLVLKYQDLYAKDYVSEVDFSNAQQKSLLIKERHASLKREAFQLENKLKSLQQKINNEERFYKEATAQLERQILALENQLLEAQSATEQIIVAKENGSIGNITRQNSQHVERGHKILTLLPEGSQLQARLLVPSESAGFLNPEQIVRIRLSAFPYQKYGMLPGKLVRISQDAVDPNALDTPIKMAEAVFVVDVSLTDRPQALKAHRLKPGMTLEADILLDTRTLFQWLTDPLDALST
ncbi:MAG: HlyD family secretion protein [Pseudomonadales bacterium]|nr:HlyD family secretion protein [Pseudomonadales bacterium]